MPLIVLIAAVLIFFSPLLGALLGYFSGWVVSFVFNETFLGIFALLGIKGYSLAQLGAFFGFIGGFFKSSLSTTKKD